MFTPQEIQEKTFTKAVFGGYDMQTVDDFLEPLTEDYITLYKENAVLKSKMKVLVEKLEEYRSQEQSMRKAILSAQRTADAMVAEAEKKCARLMADAATTAQDKVSDAEVVVSQEQERINCAKKAAQNFIEVIERDIRGHLDLLESLKSRDMSLELQQPAPRKAFDYDAEADIFHGEVQHINDVVTFQGRSIDELKQALADSVEDYLTFCAEEGRQPQKPFSGRFDLRISPELHQQLAAQAARSGMSLNRWISESLSRLANQHG